jgi:hypothetical protein
MLRKLGIAASKLEGEGDQLKEGVGVIDCKPLREL